MKLTLSSCLSVADGWVQFTCIENYTLKQRTFVVCLQLDACSLAVESGLCQWQQVSSCAENGSCWHKDTGHALAQPARAAGSNANTNTGRSSPGFPPPAQQSPAKPSIAQPQPKPGRYRSHPAVQSPPEKGQGNQSLLLAPRSCEHTGQEAKLRNTTYFGHLSFAHRDFLHTQPDS